MFRICMIYPLSEFCLSELRYAHFVVLFICVRYGSYFGFIVGASFAIVSPGRPIRLCSKLHC